MERATRGEVSNSFLTVEKDSERMEAGETAVVFTVTSTSELPLAMRIVDPLPDGASLADVGFHREHEFDHWGEVDDSHVAFSVTLLPRESVETFYYLDADSDGAASLPEPSIEETESIEADLAEEAGPPTWRSQPASVDTARVVADGPVPGGFRSEDSVVPATPSADGGSPASDDRDEPDLTAGTFTALKEEHERVEYDEIREDVEQIYPDEVEFKELLIGDEDTRLADRAERPAGGTSSDEDDGTPEALGASDARDASTRTDASPGASGATGTTGGSPGESSILAALLEELDEHELSGDDRELLRERLGLAPPHHTTVRVRHLQTKVADLTAYIDALESFLDDNGTAGELLGSLEENVSSLETDLESIESSVDGLAERQDAISTQLDAMEEDPRKVSEIQTDVARNREQLEEVTDRLGGMQDTIEYFDQRFDEVETLEATVERHETKIGELQRLAEAIEEKFRTVRATFESASRAFSVSEGE